MPIWLQATLPFVTLLLGFGLGRLGSSLDRRRNRRDTEAARSPHFVITHVDRDRFRLTNDGDAVATDMAVDFGSYNRGFLNGYQEPSTIEPGGSITFLMGAAMGVARPHEVRVTCSELPDGMPVAVPPTR